MLCPAATDCHWNSVKEVGLEAFTCFNSPSRSPPSEEICDYPPSKQNLNYCFIYSYILYYLVICSVNLIHPCYGSDHRCEAFFLSRAILDFASQVSEDLLYIHTQYNCNLFNAMVGTSYFWGGWFSRFVPVKSLKESVLKRTAHRQWLVPNRGASVHVIAVMLSFFVFLSWYFCIYEYSRGLDQIVLQVLQSRVQRSPPLVLLDSSLVSKPSLMLCMYVILLETTNSLKCGLF